jgi:hypothetical protein
MALFRFRHETYFCLRNPRFEAKIFASLSDFRVGEDIVAAQQEKHQVPKDPIGTVIGWLPILILFAATLKGLFPSIPVSGTVVAGLLAAGALTLIAAGRIAFNRLDSPTPKYIPFPAKFWRLFFNRLPTHKGTPYGTAAQVKVVIMHDPSSEAAATAIKEGHRDPTLEIELARIDTTDINPEKTLHQILKSADAVYFFWTKEIRANQRIGAALNSWALTETEKPVLIVNTIPQDPYELKFNTVPLSEAVPGLWRLLLRANERARLWIEQSEEYRRWWAWSAGIAFLAVIALGLWLKSTTNELDASNKREQVDEGQFNALAELLLTTRKDLAPQWQPATTHKGTMLNTALSHLADFVEFDIDRASGSSTDGKSQVSFFRVDENNILRQVAWSGTKTPDDFSSDRNSIVGCAVSEKAFVLWSSNCVTDSPSAWNAQGDSIGTCKGPREIEFTNDHATCTFKDLKQDKFPHKGLLCFAPEIRDGNTMVTDTAVCIDTPRDPTFLGKPWVRTKLKMLALVVNSIPTEALLTDKTRVAVKGLSSQAHNR